jgi:hypothetical protein
VHDVYSQTAAATFSWSSPSCSMHSNRVPPFFPPPPLHVPLSLHFIACKQLHDTPLVPTLPVRALTCQHIMDVVHGQGARAEAGPHMQPRQTRDGIPLLPLPTTGHQHLKGPSGGSVGAAAGAAWGDRDGAVGGCCFSIKASADAERHSRGLVEGDCSQGADMGLCCS